jgi:hypothetical protein
MLLSVDTYIVNEVTIHPSGRRERHKVAIDALNINSRGRFPTPFVSVLVIFVVKALLCRLHLVLVLRFSVACALVCSIFSQTCSTCSISARKAGSIIKDASVVTAGYFVAGVTVNCQWYRRPFHLLGVVLPPYCKFLEILFFCWRLALSSTSSHCGYHQRFPGRCSKWISCF